MKNYKLILLAILLTLVGRIYADNLSVSSIELRAGETKDVSINLNNPSKKYVAFQFDLVLPEGLSIAKNEKGKLIAKLNADRIDDHTLTVSEMGSNTYRFLSFSMTNAEFYGTDGALVSVSLHADDNITTGNKTAKITSQVFTESSGNQVKWDDLSISITIPEAVVPEIIADDKTRGYGDDNPELTYKVSADLKGTPKLSTAATKTSPVGEYDIVVERGTVEGDYTSKNGKLTVTKAALLIKGGTYTIKQGEALPTLVATYSGFKNDETESVLTKKPELTTNASSTSVPGVYDVIVSGAEAQNYDISYEKGTLTITAGTFKLNYLVDGEVYKTVSYEYGATITPEPAPTKEGYTFSGWSDIPTTMPANNVTVTGTFSINKYKLTYKVDNEVYKEYEIEFGATITPEPAPTKEGYEFSGWSDIPTTMPAYDVTIIGTYKQIVFSINDVTYEIAGEGTVSVKGGDQKGNLEIDGTVVINGQTYNVIAIAENAFKDNKQITSLTIAEGIKSIGDNAFNGCLGLFIINIGKDVTTIGNKAFANVGTSSAARTRGENVLTVNCYAESVPQTATDAFENSPIATGTLLVNDNIVDAYKTTSPWSQFGKIQGFQEAAGIDAINIDNPNAHIYDMQGNRIDNLQKGVNIIRLEDGKTKKIIVK